MHGAPPHVPTATRHATLPRPCIQATNTQAHLTPCLAISQPSASPIESSFGRQLPYFHRWLTPVSRMRHERATSAFTAAISRPLVQAASGSARRLNTTTPGMRMSAGRSASPTVPRVKPLPKISAYAVEPAGGYEVVRVRGSSKCIMGVMEMTQRCVWLYRPPSNPALHPLTREACRPDRYPCLIFAGIERLHPTIRPPSRDMHSSSFACLKCLKTRPGRVTLHRACDSGFALSWVPFQPPVFTPAETAWCVPHAHALAAGPSLHEKPHAQPQTDPACEPSPTHVIHALEHLEESAQRQLHECPLLATEGVGESLQQGKDTPEIQGRSTDVGAAGERSGEHIERPKPYCVQARNHKNAPQHV